MTNPLSRFALAGTAALMLASVPSIGHGQEGADKRTLGDLIAHVSTVTKKRMIFQERVKQVKIYGDFPMREAPDVQWKFFHSVLELNGFAIATVGAGKPHEVNKIVDARNMRRYATLTFTAKQLLANPALLPDMETFVTVVAELEHASAREVSNALRPLLDPNVGGQVIGIDKAEVVIFTDYAPNIGRLLDIVKRINDAGKSK